MKRVGSMTSDDSLFEEAKSDKDTRKAVQNQIADIKNFVKGINIDEFKNGEWFAKLLTFSLDKYVQKVNADYFRGKYPNLPPDAIVQARIKLAAKYAGIEGSLTAAAYSTAVIATLGSAGGASPVTGPAGLTAFGVDLVYASQLQLRLAYDIAVLYGVPLDLDDPEDLWKLIRIAFAIQVGEDAGNAVLKGVPAVVRPVVKAIFSGPRLVAAKSLPVIGKYLLQRNIIKISIPVVSIPLSTGVNYWMTKVTANKAREIMRKEAKMIESAKRMVNASEHCLDELLWAAWMIIAANGAQPDEAEYTLFHYLTLISSESGVSAKTLDEIRNTVEVDYSKIWSMLSQIGDAAPIYRACTVMAAVDGKITSQEIDVLRRLADCCGEAFDEQELHEKAKQWRR